MSYATNIEDPRKESHPLVVIKPRIRHTGWTLLQPGFSGNVYTATFDHGYVTRVWQEYISGNAFEVDGFGPPAQEDPDEMVIGTFFYDHSTSTIYACLASDPDAEDFPGLTVEFELHFSDTYFFGPRDPLDNSSQYVDWDPKIQTAPLAINGSTENILGVFPVQRGSISILNQDGALNEILHSGTFKQAEIQAYVLANSDLENGAVFSDIKQVFNGFCGNIALSSDGDLSVSFTDFLSIFDKSVEMYKRFNTSDFPNAEPGSVVPGAEWWVRRLYGMVDGVRPVNIDYSSSPATNNNRIWVTQYADAPPAGTVQQEIDDLAANSATRTYFVDTPFFNVGDWVILDNNVNNYVEVTAVNRGSKYIDHASVVRVVSDGDTATRYFVGRVIVVDEDDVSWYLRPGIDFSPYFDLGNLVIGLEMADNWEAAIGFTAGVFDPSAHSVVVRIYGSQSIPTDGAFTPIGEIVENGGIAAQAATVLYQLVASAGISISEFGNIVDQDSFINIAPESHSVGILIPEAHNDVSLPTTREAMSRILKSMLWRLGFVQSGNRIKIGVTAFQPFVAGADYEANEEQLSFIDYSHDYEDVYSDVALLYFKKQNNVPSLETTQFADQYTTAESLSAKHLHFINKLFSTEILQYDQAEAQEAANRFSFALGERRGLYRLILGKEFLDKTGLGASYDVSKEQMPGFAFTFGTERTRQLSLIEVQKAAQGATLTLEDQKGIQDNSGDW